MLNSFLSGYLYKEAGLPVNIVATPVKTGMYEAAGGVTDSHRLQESLLTGPHGLGSLAVSSLATQVLPTIGTAPLMAGFAVPTALAQAAGTAVGGQPSDQKIANTNAVTQGAKTLRMQRDLARQRTAKFGPQQLPNTQTYSDILKTLPRQQPQLASR